MGVQQSNLKQSGINHQRFVSSFITADNRKIIALIPIDFSKSDFQYWRTKSQQIRADPNSKQLFLPQTYDEEVTAFGCGNNLSLKLSFKNYPCLLQEEIKNRSLNCQQNYFEEQELWMLLYTLLKSQRAFSNISMKVGDIHPHNIFINEQGYPKLACQFTWPNEKTNFEKMIYDKVCRYLSPEQMRLCELGQHHNICYAATSQAFSIGLTMLGTGILQSLDKICYVKTFRFNEKYLDYCINRWMSLKFKSAKTQQMVSYSEELKNIVKGLCQVNIKQRLLPSQIYQTLECFDSEIMSLNSFKFPQKVNKTQEAKNGPQVNLSFAQNTLNAFPLANQRLSNHRDLFYKYAAYGLQQNSKIRQNGQINKVWPVNGVKQITERQSSNGNKQDLMFQSTQALYNRAYQLPKYAKDHSIQKKQSKGSQISIFQYGNTGSLINGQKVTYDFKPKEQRFLANQSMKNNDQLKQAGLHLQGKQFSTLNQGFTNYAKKSGMKETPLKRQPPAIEHQSKYQFNSGFLQKLDRQIKDSQKYFPENDLSHKDQSGSKYKDRSQKGLLETNVSVQQNKISQKTVVENNRILVIMGCKKEDEFVCQVQSLLTQGGAIYEAQGY